MSKLINSIKEVQLNKAVKTVPIDYASFKEHWDTDRAYGHEIKTYALQATLGIKVEIDDDFTGMSRSEILTECLHSTRHLIAEEVFGEFRKPLLGIRLRAASRGDLDSVKDIDAVLDSMFKV